MTPLDVLAVRVETLAQDMANIQTSVNLASNLLNAIASQLKLDSSTAWRPIETAPHDRDVLVREIIGADDSGCIEVCFWQSGHWFVTWDHSEYGDATHWAEIPK